MCTEMNSKSRKLSAIASACLAIGLPLLILLHPAQQSARNLLHFIGGLLLGLSISINLSLVWKNSRQRRLSGGPRL
jgi:hypothetical protein